MQFILPTRDGHAEEKSGKADYESLAQKDDKVSHLVDKEASENVWSDQSECILGCPAEARANHGCHDVGVPVEVSYQLLKDKEAAPEKPDDALQKFVVWLEVVDPVVDILHNNPKELDEGKKERSKSHSSKMVPGVL